MTDYSQIGKDLLAAKTPNADAAKRGRRMQISRFEAEILDLIDNRDDYTRSDLQGIVSALVARILKAGRA